MTRSLIFSLKPSLRQVGILLACCALVACHSSERLTPLEPNATILAFGDSLTFGTGVDADASYPAALANMLSQQVVRSGVPGEVSADGLKRLKAELLEHQPELVVLCHGGNDILRRLPSAQTKQNLTAMIHLIRSQGAEVVLLAVPNVRLFPKAASYYGELEEELDVPVEYEILSRLQADSGKKSDAVHFNPAGYRELAEAVFALLDAEGAL